MAEGCSLLLDQQHDYSMLSGTHTHTHMHAHTHTHRHNTHGPKRTDGATHTHVMSPGKDKKIQIILNFLACLCVKSSFLRSGRFDPFSADCPSTDGDTQPKREGECEMSTTSTAVFPVIEQPNQGRALLTIKGTRNFQNMA